MDLSNTGGVWQQLWQPRGRRLILFSVFIFAFGLTLYNGKILSPERGDPARWDYTAQSIVRGQIPYRDVVELKTPLSAYISALVIVAGRAAGINELIAIRYVGIVLACLLLVVVFAVTEAYTNNRLAALIAVLAPLSVERFYSWGATGTEPKISMILFGLLSLLLISKNKPFWAGVASMFSCLCWQPGLMFAGVAVLVFSRYLRSWRDLRAAKTIAGASVPLLVTLLYFYCAGALRDLWIWCFWFDLTVYASDVHRSLSEQISHIAGVTYRVLGKPGVIFLAAGALGYLAVLIGTLRKRRTDDAALPGSTPAVALLIPPAIYVAYWRFDFNSGPYLIPIVPFAAIFAGWLVSRWIRLIPSRSQNSRERPVICREYAGLVAVALLTVVAVATSAGTKYRDTTLGDEYAALEVLRAILLPEDKIWAQGEVNILVLLDRPSVSKHIWFDRGKDDFAAAEKPGGFQQVLGEIDAQQPRFVEMGRIETVHHSAELEAWLAEEYKPLPTLSIEVYVRKDSTASDSERGRGPVPGAVATGSHHAGRIRTNALQIRIDHGNLGSLVGRGPTEVLTGFISRNRPATQE
jgi:hypothetical protein